MYERVLVPLDQSVLGESILTHAAEISRCFDSEMILFHVTPGYADVMRTSMPAAGMGTAGSTISPDLIQETVDAGQSAGQRYLDGVIERFRGSGINVRSVLAQGAPARTILEFCKDEEISLITMSTHGHSGLARTVMGSVADEVMRESGVPVLLLRPGENAS